MKEKKVTLLKIDVDRGTKPLHSLVGQLGTEMDPVLAITLDKRLVTQFYVNDEMRNFLKNEILLSDKWITVLPIGCCSGGAHALANSISQAVTVFLSDLARELFPDILKELHPEGKSEGQEC